MPRRHKGAINRTNCCAMTSIWHSFLNTDSFFLFLHFLKFTLPNGVIGPRAVSGLQGRRLPAFRLGRCQQIIRIARGRKGAKQTPTFASANAAATCRQDADFRTMRKDPALSAARHPISAVRLARRNLSRQGRRPTPGKSRRGCGVNTEKKRNRACMMPQTGKAKRMRSAAKSPDEIHTGNQILCQEVSC